MAGAATPFHRTAMIDRLRSGGTFDVIVIGGGITGAGVALDAASRGLSVALVERDDFAAGTSSKSSKLVHGGLRYLQQGEIRLVYEALHERQRLRRNAPHLVQVLPFMIPILTRDGLVPRKIARTLGTAMWMYDLTGGIRFGKLHRRLRGDAAHAHMPTIQRDRLSSAYLYYDATADDARLTLTIARTAAAHGAVVANRCEVVSVEPGDATSQRVRVVDSTSGAPIDVTASAVVNATGVWSDEISSLHHANHASTIRPAKGVHITIPWAKVRNDVAVVIPVPGDRRRLFVVPWGERSDGTFEHCYVGTTDTDYDGPLDAPQCTAEDIEYILGALNALIDPSSDEPITTSDITATWAGLRPLVTGTSSSRTADLSRRHEVSVSDDGVIRVTGGKLTTYREMAEDTVDLVQKRLGLDAKCRTKRLPLLGTAAVNALERLPWRSKDPVEMDMNTDHLAARYGTLASDVRALVAQDPSLGKPLVEGLPYLRAEAVYAVREEMATTLIDVLTRRTRAHLMDRDATRAAAPDIAALLAPIAGWDENATTDQLAAYESLCDAELTANTA